MLGTVIDASDGIGERVQVRGDRDCTLQLVDCARQERGLCGLRANKRSEGEYRYIWSILVVKSFPETNPSILSPEGRNVVGVPLMFSLLPNEISSLVMEGWHDVRRTASELRRCQPYLGLCNVRVSLLFYDTFRGELLKSLVEKNVARKLLALGTEVFHYAQYW